MNSRAASWRQSYSFLLVATLILVALADVFLYGGHRIGWTAAIVGGAMLVVLVARDARFLGSLGGRIVWLATVGLLLALVEQPTWLNITYLFVCLSALALTNAQGWDSDFVRWLRRWTRWAATGWAKFFFDNGIAMRWLVRHGLPPGVARSLVMWVIPLLLSSVFVALFAWANPIISDSLGRFFNWLGRLLAKLPNLLDGARILFWLVVAIVAWALLRSRSWGSARRRQPAAATVVTAKVVARDGRPVGGVTAGLVVRCLILFNLIFVVEIALDLWVLYGNHYGNDGTAYKTYVRRGAYPLVAAALLAGAFVLVTFRPGSATEKSNAARKLVYLWIGQTIILTLSAVWRLERYIELTELTRLRIASIVWFTLVGLGLAYIIWRIVRGRTNRWLVNVNALTALVLIYPCCFVNFDGMIADFNAKHCEEAGGGGSPLDIEYFDTLGTPALAALDSVRDRIPIQWRRDQAAEVSKQLHADLAKELDDWRSWTWRKHRSNGEVEAVQLARSRAKEQIAQASPPPSR